MNIPYIKELLFVATGLNISFFILSVAMDDYTLMGISLVSAAACAFGINKKNETDRGDTR